MNTIFITGASSGLGHATAKHFHANGWNVVATMRNPDAAEGLAALDDILVTRLDVTDSDSITDAVDTAIERFGAIDVLLNNAGYGAYGALEAFSMDRIRRQFDTNVIGLLDVTKQVLPHMRRRRSGTIINISSIGGQITFPLGTLYHGTKFAVEGLSEALHYELEPLGIRVRIVQPGRVATNFGGSSFDFALDDTLTEYAHMPAAMQNVFNNAISTPPSTPDVVVDVIWAAANDTGNRLRYRAGPDATELLDRRKTEDDATFIGSFKAAMSG